MNILNIKLAARADTEKTQQKKKKENKNSEHRKYEPEEMHTAQY